MSIPMLKLDATVVEASHAEVLLAQLLERGIDVLGERAVPLERFRAELARKLSAAGAVRDDAGWHIAR